MAVPQLTDRPGASGRVHVEHVAVDHTELRIGPPRGPAVVCRVDAVPDLPQARRMRRGLDRVVWQRVDLHDGHAHASLRGTRHRRPSSMPVSLPTALGLMLDGVPTFLGSDARSHAGEPVGEAVPS